MWLWLLPFHCMWLEHCWHSQRPSHSGTCASADRLEFRFRSAGDSVDMACSQIVVPSTWLVVSRVSAPTLIKNARWCREHYARIEEPDQTMQLSQLAGIHAYWTAAVEAASIEETGPRIGAVGEHSPGQCSFDLRVSALTEKKIVPKNALVLQAHAVESEQSTAVLPPVTGARLSCASAPVRLRASAGAPIQSLSVTMAAQMAVSVTEPGQAPMMAGLERGTVLVQRGPLETRMAEAIWLRPR